MVLDEYRIDGNFQLIVQFSTRVDTVKDSSSKDKIGENLVTCDKTASAGENEKVGHLPNKVVNHGASIHMRHILTAHVGSATCGLYGKCR